MAHDFAPRHFLRMAPNDSLQQYFREKGTLSDVDFENRSESDIEDIYQAWMALPSTSRAEVDIDFGEIDEVANAHVDSLIKAEAQRAGIELPPEFFDDTGAHDKAFYLFLHCIALFTHVHRMATTMDRPERYWARRNDLPEIPRVPTSQEVLQRLEGILSYFFTNSQGRGQNSVVETLEGEGGTFFFCYLEDFGRADIGFDEDGHLHRGKSRPAFEVIFVVSPARNSLDTFFQGKRQLVAELERLFSRTVLGFDLPNGKQPLVYDLNRLKDRDFQFRYDPVASGITGVSLRHLRFASFGAVNKRITLEADRSLGNKAVYDFMDEVFDSAAPRRGKLPLAAFNITQARVQVHFEPIPRRRKPSKTFNITFPNGCTLPHDLQGEAIRQMLRLSGLESVPVQGTQQGLT